MIFQDEKWLNEAERHGLNPVLVGFDLEYYYKSEKSLTIAPKTSGKLDEKYLVLQPGDMSGDFTTYSRDIPELFFSCLKPYEFDKANKLVRLRNRLTIYIGAVFDDPEILKLPDLTKLTSLPAWRESLCGEELSRYFDLRASSILIHRKIL